MKKHTTFVLLLILLSSCSKYAQVYEASPSGKNTTRDKKNFWVYENDTIKIVYSFWNEKGKMSFAVFNKHSKPIYIDWKKCAYILNGTKNDYYQESVTSTSVSVGASYVDLFGKKVGASTDVAKSVKNERVMFLPPGSGIMLNSGYLLSSSIFNISDFKEAKSEMKKSGQYLMPITFAQSPIKFRNFITYSTTENFTNEHYADNEFYVSSVATMKSNKFVVSAGQRGGVPIFNCPSEGPDKFYYHPISPSQLK